MTQRSFLLTAYPVDSVIDRLSDEVDSEPTILRCLVTLNAAYWQGTSPVCGIVNARGFKLRSRQGPGFSVQVEGRFVPVPGGTRIELFSSRSLPAKLYRWTRDRHEEQQIVEFVRKTLHATVERPRPAPND